MSGVVCRSGWEHQLSSGGAQSFCASVEHLQRPRSDSFGGRETGRGGRRSATSKDSTDYRRPEVGCQRSRSPPSTTAYVARRRYVGRLRLLASEGTLPENRRDCEKWTKRAASAYLSSTVPPASSSSCLSLSASSFSMPSLTGFGASSTSALASLRPRPVAARTTLMTWIFFSPGPVRTTSTVVETSSSAAAPSPAAAAGAAAATAVADTPNSSSSALMRSARSATEMLLSSSIHSWVLGITPVLLVRSKSLPAQVPIRVPWPAHPRPAHPRLRLPALPRLRPPRRGLPRLPHPRPELPPPRRRHPGRRAPAPGSGQ